MLWTNWRRLYVSGNDSNKKTPPERERGVSLNPVPFEEAVGDLLKVKKPEGKTKPKKAQSRERKKRNV